MPYRSQADRWRDPIHVERQGMLAEHMNATMYGRARARGPVHGARFRLPAIFFA